MEGNTVPNKCHLFLNLTTLYLFLNMPKHCKMYDVSEAHFKNLGCFVWPFYRWQQMSPKGSEIIIKKANRSVRIETLVNKGQLSSFLIQYHLFIHTSHMLTHNFLSFSQLGHELFSSAGHIYSVAKRHTFIVSLSPYCWPFLIMSLPLVCLCCCNVPPPPLRQHPVFCCHNHQCGLSPSSLSEI